MTSQNSPRLSTVKNLPNELNDVVTVSAVRQHIFNANDRANSKGQKIKGNGLAEYGAILRCGRKILIDIDRYIAWLTSNRV